MGENEFEGPWKSPEKTRPPYSTLVQTSNRNRSILTS